jgi:hypothetical protein
MQRASLVSLIIACLVPVAVTGWKNLVNKCREVLKHEKFANSAIPKRTLPTSLLGLIEAEGIQALATWEGLRLTHPGSSPVVVGGLADFKRIVEGATAWPGRPAHRTPAQIIESADRLHHPEDLYRQHERDVAEMRERIEQLKRESPGLTPPPQFQLPDYLKEAFGGKVSAMSGDETIESPPPWGEPHIGEWPIEPMGAPELSVATETLTGAPLDNVQIVILPTDDSSTIPAYLHWGHWNGCPAPEYHIAALRSWRERFGAELVGLSDPREVCPGGGASRDPPIFAILRYAGG